MAEEKKPIVDWTAETLSAAIHAKTVSCREVLEAYLAQIEQYNGPVNAIVALQDREQLFKLADERDEELAKGKSRGWMHGFPIAVKDLSSVKGLPSTSGSKPLEKVIGQADSLYVERMRENGAIFIGRTNVPEFGLGSHTYNPVYGRTGNSFNHQLSAGGSSGGAAVALSLKMLPVADGSDMMGSLRNPSAWNNVYGFRPTPGVVARAGKGDLFLADLSTEGPMARNAKDLELFFDVLAGFDPRDPLSKAGVFPVEPKESSLPIKAGWLGNLDGYLEFDPDLLKQSIAASQLIGEVKNTSIESIAATNLGVDFNQLWEAWVTLRGWTVMRLNDELPLPDDQKALIKPEFQWEVGQGRQRSAQDINKASLVRSHWFRTVSELFKTYDFLVIPSTQIYPFPKEWNWPKTINDKKMDTYHRWMEVTIYASIIGLPAATVPVGFSSEGLPLGLQIIGPKLSDRKLLKFLQRLEPVFADPRKSFKSFSSTM